jgi:hypothetical protein
MDMMRLIKAIRFANTVNHMRGEKNKGLETFSRVSHQLETMHEASEVTRHVVNKEVSSEDLHYIIRIGKRHGPGVANRVYARYMKQRALEAQEALEEEVDEPETTQD